MRDDVLKLHKYIDIYCTSRIPTLPTLAEFALSAQSTTIRAKAIRLLFWDLVGYLGGFPCPLFGWVFFTSGLHLMANSGCILRPLLPPGRSFREPLPAFRVHPEARTV